MDGVLEADTAVVLPQRDPGVGGGEAHRHLARADVRDQQRQDRVPQRPAAGEARQGRHQHLRDLLPEPPGLVPILLPRMQGTVTINFSLSLSSSFMPLLAAAATPCCLILSFLFLSLSCPSLSLAFSLLSAKACQVQRAVSLSEARPWPGGRQCSSATTRFQLPHGRDDT